MRTTSSICDVKMYCIFIKRFFCSSNKGLTVQELDPPPPDRMTLMITHWHPHVGDRQGIEILESLVRKLGFLDVSNKDNSGG